jgi:hypothetical protein
VVDLSRILHSLRDGNPDLAVNVVILARETEKPIAKFDLNLAMVRLVRNGCRHR